MPPALGSPWGLQKQQGGWPEPDLWCWTNDFKGVSAVSWLNSPEPRFLICQMGITGRTGMSRAGHQYANSSDSTAN